MFPNRPEMNFTCGCPVFIRKNVWSDITGVHVRFCPLCNERREQFYDPSMAWEDTGRGLAGEPEPDYIRKARHAAVPHRGKVRNPNAV